MDNKKLEISRNIDNVIRCITEIVATATTGQGRHIQSSQEDLKYLLEKLFEKSETPTRVKKAICRSKISNKQYHVGTHPKLKTKVFIRDNLDLFWNTCLLKDLTKEELLKMARSIEADLLRLYPELE